MSLFKSRKSKISKPFEAPSEPTLSSQPKSTNVELELKSNKLNETTKSVIYGAPDMTKAPNDTDDKLLASIYKHIEAALDDAQQLTPLAKKTLAMYQASMESYQVYEYFDHQS